MAHTNAVNEVAKRAGLDLSRNTAFNENAASVTKDMSRSAGQLSKITEMAKEFADQGPQAASAGPQAGPTSGFTKFAVGVGLAVAGAVAGPVAAPVIAGAAAAFALSDAVGSMSTSHAAIDGGVGEMTLASAVAKFDKNDEMTHYTSACDGVTTSVADGKAVARTTIGPSAVAPATGAHNFSQIIGEVAGEFDAKEVQGALLAAADKKTVAIGQGQRRLVEMGADLNDPTLKNFGSYVDEMNTDIRAAVKPQMPKALNVGMGAPGMA